MPRPSAAELEAAVRRRVPDVLRDGLSLLFCGINPGLWSGATGHHFARPGNRFWKLLHLSGFTDRQLRPNEEQQLLDLGLGITNLVARVTASAAEVSLAELREGALRLERVVATARPGVVAVLGMGAYRRAWSRPTAELGLQPERLGGAEIFLLPNPSGLQARYQLAEMVALFSKLREVSGYSAR